MGTQEQAAAATEVPTGAAGAAHAAEANNTPEAVHIGGLVFDADPRYDHRGLPRPQINPVDVPRQRQTPAAPVDKQPQPEVSGLTPRELEQRTRSKDVDAQLKYLAAVALDGYRALGSTERGETIYVPYAASPR